MNNETTKLIPELRFPEFAIEGEWEAKEVGEIFEVTRGYVLAMGLVKENKSNEYPYPVFSSQTKNNGLAGYYKEYLYEDAITWTTDGAKAGDVNYRTGKFYCTNVCGVLINRIGFANSCIAELINSVSKNYVSYVGNPKLMNGVMSKIIIPIPSLQEQQKIASCLSSLDEVITAHSQKLEALKDHKKGLMQNLFPQEGETVPAYRFPDFSGSWQIKELSKCIQLISGLHLSPDDYAIKGEIPYFTGPSDFTNKETDIKKWTKKSSNTANAEDTLITVKGSGVGELWYLTVPCVAMGRQLMAVRAKGCSSRFLYYFLGTKRSRFEDFASGNLIPGLTRNDILSLEIPVPSILEQQKIASCLSSLDALITAQTEKIAQLNLHKKGLMQGLFPKN